MRYRYWTYHKCARTHTQTYTTTPNENTNIETNQTHPPEYLVNQQDHSSIVEEARHASCSLPPRGGLNSPTLVEVQLPWHNPSSPKANLALPIDTKSSVCVLSMCSPCAAWWNKNEDEYCTTTAYCGPHTPNKKQKNVLFPSSIGIRNTQSDNETLAERIHTP